MKYKRLDVELPPLGELVVVKARDVFAIGEYFLNNCGVRGFNSRCFIKEASGKPDQFSKWASLPKFKSIKKDKPPIGIDILVACRDDYVEEEAYNCFHITHFTKNQIRLSARNDVSEKEIEVEAWLPLEAFDEE